MSLYFVPIALILYGGFRGEQKLRLPLIIDGFDWYAALNSNQSGANQFPPHTTSGLRHNLKYWVLTLFAVERRDTCWGSKYFCHIQTLVHKPTDVKWILFHCGWNLLAYGRTEYDPKQEERADGDREGGGSQSVPFMGSTLHTHTCGCVEHRVIKCLFFLRVWYR